MKLPALSLVFLRAVSRLRKAAAVSELCTMNSQRDGWSWQIFIQGMLYGVEPELCYQMTNAEGTVGGMQY